MKKISTLYSSYQELLLDLDIFGSIIKAPQLNKDEYKKVLFEDYKKTHHKPSLEDKRYELSDLVSSDFHVSYTNDIELKENEEEIALNNGVSSEGYSLVPKDETIVVPDEIKQYFKYGSKVTDSDRDSLLNSLDYFKETEGIDNFKGSTEEVEAKFGTIVENTNNIYIEPIEKASDEEIIEPAESTAESSEDEDADSYDISSDDESSDEENSSEEVQDTNTDNVENDEDSEDDEDEDEDADDYDYSAEDDSSDDEVENKSPAESTTEQNIDSAAEDTTNCSGDEESDSEDEDADDYDYSADEDDTEESKIDAEEPNKEIHNGDENKFVDSVIDTSDDDLGFIKKPVEHKEVVTPVVPIKPVVVEKKVEEVIDRESEPTNLRAFLRKHPHSEVSFVLQYFSKKEVQKAIMMGTIIKKGNKLHI